jgi:hypothetical protein
MVLAVNLGLSFMFSQCPPSSTQFGTFSFVQHRAIPPATITFTLMNRNLLYIAITRAKRLVVLGERRALAVYVRQVRGRERHTGLVERLVAEM